MISMIDATSRHYKDHGWLKTYHLFSFADYFDPRNLNFGTLRVFNDDTIEAQTGFGEHHHENMEIVTIVLDGKLTHKDSIGNIGTIKAGEVQYMSAGTGVTHAELNSSDAPVHLFQIWVMPDRAGLEPTYAQKDFTGVGNKDTLVPVASGQSKTGDLYNSSALKMRTNATIYTCTMDARRVLEFSVKTHRGAFLYLYEGKISINNTEFNTFDQARIHGPADLIIRAALNSKFILIDVPI